MSDIADIKDLIRRMCIYLVQQTVVVKWQPPSTVHAAGEIYLENGVIIIEINPILSPEKMYETALHEAAHYIAGHKIPDKVLLFPRYEKFKQLYAEHGPYLEKTATEWKEYTESPREREANNIAEALDRVAQNTAERLYGNTEIQSRITALFQVEIRIQKENHHD